MGPARFHCATLLFILLCIEISYKYLSLVVILISASISHRKYSNQVAQGEILLFDPNQLDVDDMLLKYVLELNARTKQNAWLKDPVFAYQNTKEQ